MTNGSDKYVYNNTIYNCDIALYDNGGSANIYVSNNAIFGCNDDFSGTFELLDYNASDDGDGTNAIDISPCAVESECWKSAFLDYENYDFRVRAANSVLHDTGTTITIVEDDIIGTVRPTDANYDIGAFEYTGIKPKFRFTPGTNATFRGYFEFK
jgi:hypothetical protein